MIKQILKNSLDLQKGICLTEKYFKLSILIFSEEPNFEIPTLIQNTNIWFNFKKLNNFKSKKKSSLFQRRRISQRSISQNDLKQNRTYHRNTNVPSILFYRKGHSNNM